MMPCGAFFFPLVFLSTHVLLLIISISNGCTMNLMQIPCILITSEKQGKEKILFILAHSVMTSLKIVLCNIPVSHSHLAARPFYLGADRYRA